MWGDFWRYLWNKIVGDKINMHQTTIPEGLDVSSAEGVSEVNSGTGSLANGAIHIWGDLTGQSNTQMQNSAAAALQEDAQAFNSHEAAAQRAWESEEAEKNRLWQEQMSNTAYQRSVNDLQSAGLNPWLAVGNGASTGSGVMSSGATGSSPIASAQASQVNMLAGIGTAAAGIAMLIKVIKAIK